VGVNPVETTACGHLTDISGNRHRIAVVEQDQMLVDVDSVAFHRVARDAGDHFTSSRCGVLARSPLRTGERRKGECGTGKEDERTKSGHG
jgi:hypothetical protein